MIRAPKIIGETWFNSEPLTGDLKGKVVLYDFWTYSCVNCLRTLPYLRDWWAKYKDRGLVIIGIHAPEFEFEKDPQNVGQGIKDLNIAWPVVLDNDHVNWNNFANRFWPAKYLADKDGRIVYSHFGEGAYAETEQKVRGLLGLDTDSREHGISPTEHEHGAVCFTPTPETYCGYLRGQLANSGGYQRDKTTHYSLPTTISDGTIALAGKFLAAKEYVESREEGAEPGSRASPHYPAELLLRFHATEVNLVLRPVGQEAIIEVSFGGEGKEIKIAGPRLYNLLRSDFLMEGIVSIKSKRGNFRAYAFTFSGCEH